MAEESLRTQVNLLERVQDGTLITKAQWSDKYGFHPKIFVELITQHWIWSTIVIVGVLFGILSPFIL